MSELSNLLKNTDFENISLEELVHLEDSLQRFENTTEKSVLEKLKQKIADKYNSFRSHTDVRFTVHKIRTGYDEEGWGNGEGDISREDLQKLNLNPVKSYSNFIFIKLNDKIYNHLLENKIYIRRLK